MTYAIHGNLDCEATWSGVALPPRVVRRISAASALLAALAPDGEPACVWAPGEVDRERLVGRPPPTMLVGTPPHADLRWADPAARPHNDRRFALGIAAELGVALPGACAIGSLVELERHLAAGGAAASTQREWVCKALWTSAGRDRCFGDGDQVTGDRRTRIERLIARSGAVVFEPWLDRIADVGMCAEVATGGAVTAYPPHQLLVDARGAFIGIDLESSPLGTAERDQLAAVVDAAGAALAHAGYAGPFTIDAFVYLDGGSRRLHPLCELNARYSFGRVARALGARVLGFGAVPSGATVLVAPTRDDPFTAWVAA